MYRYTMRTLFAVLALTMAFGFLSEASTDVCALNYGITKEMIHKRPSNLTEEQIHCLYDCFLKRVNWVHPNGTFNERSLDKQNDTQRKEAMIIVKKCTENANDARCSFSGCLLKLHFANSYSYVSSTSSTD